MADGQGVLLVKVPRWLAEIWSSAPEGQSVGDLDLDAGQLLLNVEDGSGKPAALEVSRRECPELFTFTKSGDAMTVNGGIAASLHVKASLQDTVYKQMLTRRVKESAIDAGHRSDLEEKFVHPDNRPTREVIAESSVRREPVGDDSVLLRDGTSSAEVALAVEKCLRANEGGVTVEVLLRDLPNGSSLESIRDALVASADCRTIGTERRFFFSAALRAALGETTEGTKKHSAGPRREKDASGPAQKRQRR